MSLNFKNLIVKRVKQCPKKFAMTHLNDRHVSTFDVYKSSNCKTNIHQNLALRQVILS